MIHNTCNMAIRDLPDMYTISPRACGPQAEGIHIYISGKSPMAMLQPLHMYLTKMLCCDSHILESFHVRKMSQINVNLFLLIIAFASFACYDY